MNSSTPADLLELKAQFDAWRQAHSPRSRFPAHLWQAAVALLDRHPAQTICRICQLRPDSLKQRAARGSASSASAVQSSSPFLQLSPEDVARPHHLPSAQPASPPCRLLLERPDGSRLTLLWPPLDLAALSTLCAQFWRAEEK